MKESIILPRALVSELALMPADERDRALWHVILFILGTEGEEKKYSRIESVAKAANTAAEEKQRAWLLTEDEYRMITDRLREKTGKKYNPRAAHTRQKIDARIAEGHTTDELLAAVDYMAQRWGNNEEMRRYLRPETLFGPKFESYLPPENYSEAEEKGSFDTEDFYRAAVGRSYREYINEAEEDDINEYGI